MRHLICFAVLTLASSVAFTANGKMPSDAQPTTAQTASFESGLSSTGWMDFDFSNARSILIPAKVNGRAVLVKLIDGAETSYIDKDFAASLGLKPAATVKESGRLDVQVQLGALTLRQVASSVVGLGAKRTDKSFAPFILSDDLFNHAIVDIDFAHHRIAFKDPKTNIEPLPGALEIPLIKRLDSLTVPVSIDRNAPVPFEWYLGDPAPITIYAPYYEAHQLLQHGPTSIRLGGGLGGQRPQEPVATLSHVQFAGVNFSDVPGVFPSNAVRGSDSPLISGNIGLALLSRFRLVIDYPHQRLYVAPYAGMESAPFARDRLGLYLSRQGPDFVVDFVAPGSPAQVAGFKTGERIVAIDQKPSQNWSPAELAELGFASNGDVMVFTMGDGKNRQVKARNYF